MGTTIKQSNQMPTDCSESTVSALFGHKKSKPAGSNLRASLIMSALRKATSQTDCWDSAFLCSNRQAVLRSEGTNPCAKLAIS